MNKETNSPRTKSPTESPILEDTLISSASPDFLFDAIKSMPFFEDGRMAFLRKGISSISTPPFSYPLSISLGSRHEEKIVFKIKEYDNDKYVEECQQNGVLPFSILSFDTGQLKIHYPPDFDEWKEHPCDILLRGGGIPHALYVSYRRRDIEEDIDEVNDLEQHICENIIYLDKKGYFVCDGLFNLGLCYAGTFIDYAEMRFERKNKSIDLEITPGEDLNNEQEEKLFSWVRSLKEKYGSCSNK